MRSLRRVPLTPMMLALAMSWTVIPAVYAAEAEQTDVQPDTTQTGTSAEPIASTALRAQAALAQATALYRKANFVEAKDHLGRAHTHSA